ncbi:MULTISPECIES: sugar dehydrogenase complex small subunit [Paraburkholderia]|uniref:Sorbitol dehydrogenase family protein n=1 Tax=Paraburkholderia madseniana TaxID=2599607 RepID=A0AAP5B6T5_9BURK|nr:MULTISPECIES: sugar dehydrogenase complex small subunit [Paraburkholderia]MCX4143944.1 sugar dehydrogenase complex small subunit [Paraburkholderia madseniana]MDN7146898.1 sorbitol dehydrogenase family protein [Paraburkholderia sp. WS6]MDQ6405778.1 sorbitol dehydrogenase family protein [Paraburkholderia madseniana]
MTDVPENKDAHHDVTHLARFPSPTSPKSSSPLSSPGSTRSSSLHASFSASRRAWVLGACATAAALAFAGAGRSLSWIAPAFADTAPPGGGLDAFLALSQRLTGHTGFDAVLGKRVYDALARSDSQFSQNVAALNTWLQGHGGVPSDTVTQALQVDQPALAKSVSAIMRAWYLGLVGDMPHVDVVAYEKALMFEPVKDVLTIPSYCRDVPFYWTQKPVSA